MGIMQVNEPDAWESEVMQSGIPVFVKFYAEWCGHCRKIKQSVEELSDEYGGRIKFVEVDTDKSDELISRYEVESTPTLFVFSKGSIVAQHAGSAPKSTYKGMIDGALGPSS